MSKRKMKDRLGWKIYLIVVSLLLLGALVSELTDDVQLGFVDYADYIITAGALAGVFGYAFRKQLLREKLWRALLPAVVVWDSWIGFESFKETNATLSNDEVWFLYVVLVVALVLILPEYIALYLYGYRSKDIWVAK